MVSKKVFHIALKCLLPVLGSVYLALYSQNACECWCLCVCVCVCVCWGGGGVVSTCLE